MYDLRNNMFIVLSAECCEFTIKLTGDFLTENFQKAAFLHFSESLETVASFYRRNPSWDLKGKVGIIEKIKFILNHNDQNTLSRERERDDHLCANLHAVRARGLVELNLECKLGRISGSTGTLYLNFQSLSK